MAWGEGKIPGPSGSLRAPFTNHFIAPGQNPGVENLLGYFPKVWEEQVNPNPANEGKYM